MNVISIVNRAVESPFQNVQLSTVTHNVMHILTIRDSYYSFFDACDFLDPYYEVYTINLVSFYTIHVLHSYTLCYTHHLMK